MSKLKTGVVIVSVLITLGIIGLIFQNPYLVKERESDIGHATIEQLDSIINNAIIHCETDGRYCDTYMPNVLEVCKNEPEYKDVPSCNDGRIEQLIENPIVMSEECEKIHEIKKNMSENNRMGQIPIEEFRLLDEDWTRLGCP